ncbi:MAG TPA: hypothetical protein PK014_12620 [Thermoanaerobaculia bacterium]|nr:hypothetical protein [Thermoanaerobaculia bacterium]HUM30882.1 hypothetical protein [Thermoanaerobaculia bacterium]HXK69193.1 hypothetical protein [Thermoanaerobaculia bacterium]
MRTVECLQLLGTAGAAVGSIVVSFKMRLLRHLRRKGATSPEGAIPLDLRAPLSRWFRDRLLRAGVLVSPDEGTFFLNEEAYRIYRNRRIRLALSILVTGAALLALALKFFN